MSYLFANNAASTLAAGITNVATSITVATGQGALFPTPSGSDVFQATLVRASDLAIEIVTVTARSGDVMTVTRAQEGTTGLAFLTGDKFELRLTKAVMESLTTDTEAAGKTNMTGFPVDSSGNYLCTLTYNETTRTVTITPTGATFDIYVAGVKHTFTGAQSIVHSATGAGQFVYFDATGTLVTGTTAWNILLHAPVCYIFQDATNSRRIPFDERHHAGRDLYWHNNQHAAEGTKAVSGFTASGYTLNNGASDGVLHVAIASGRVDDEDISVTTQALAAAGPYNLLYRSGASGDWLITRTSVLPFFYTGNNLQYNQNTGATWQLTNVTEDNFVNYWVFALTALPTTDITPSPSSTQQIVIIAGQAIYSSQAAADAETVSSLAYGSVLFQEMAPLYKMTFKFNASNPSAYTNTARTALTAISRVVGSFASLTATAQSDHGALTGLTDQDHPASAIIFTPTGNIAATDVQAAIAELDTEKQAALVSGTNIKTVNNVSLLGSGNIAAGDVTLSGTESLTNKTINKVTITTPATGSTLTIADGKTFTVLKTISLTAADDTGVYTLPTGTKTLVATDVATLSSLASVGTLTTGTWNATAIGVQYGGTGRATGTTAYGLIAAGTTATGAQQTLAAGLTTEILVGGGASALPVWTTATGSGSPVRATSPILVTPTLGVATATSMQGIVGNVTPAAGTFTALTSTTSTTLASESVALTANNLPTVRPTLLLDFANSKSVDPRITFTRASTATRINDKGLIETVASGAPRIDYDPVTLAPKGLLVEEARTNLLTYSEQFDNAAWSYVASTVTANATTAPNGTTTAYKLVETTASSQHVNYQTGITISAGSTLTSSIYVKAGERNSIWLQTSNSVFNSGFRAVVTGLNTSTPTVISVVYGTATVSSATAVSIGGGWFRVSCTGTVDASATSVNTGVWLRNASNADNYTGDGTSGLYIWGAQLEAGSFATSYIPSAQTFTGRASTATYIGSNGLIQSAGSGVARYQYNPLNLTVAPFLLLEAAATNLLTYSEQFDNAAWSKSNATITANATTAPDGTVTAEKLVEDSSASTIHSVYQSISGLTDSTVHVAAFFLKAAERTKCLLSIMDKAAITRGMVFDLVAGTIASFNSGGIVDPSYYGIKPFTNEWYLCWVGHSVGTGAFNPRAWPSLHNGTTNSYTGDGTSGIYIWGAQLEAGSFATSYIPTTSATVTRVADSSTSAQVTRAADAASMTGTNFSSWYRQDEGTFVVEFTTSITTTSAYRRVIDANDGTNPNTINLEFDGSGTGKFAESVGNSTNQAFVISDVKSANTGIKAAFAYKVNDISAAFDGTLATSDTSASLPTCTQLNIGSSPTGSVNYMIGHIARIAYYPKRLTNSTLQALSTL